MKQKRNNVIDENLKAYQEAVDSNQSEAVEKIGQLIKFDMEYCESELIALRTGFIAVQTTLLALFVLLITLYFTTRSNMIIFSDEAFPVVLAIVGLFAMIIVWEFARELIKYSDYVIECKCLLYNPIYECDKNKLRQSDKMLLLLYNALWLLVILGCGLLVNISDGLHFETFLPFVCNALNFILLSKMSLRL